MDNLPGVQPVEQTAERKFPFGKKQIILAVVALVIIGELIWAALTLTSNNDQVVDISSKNQVSTESSAASLSLRSTKENFKVGENIPVTIEITSQSAVEGADIVLLYNPSLLSVVSSPSAKVAVTPGTIFTDYPINQAEETSGKVTFSGITSQPGGVLAQGVFGTVTFQAKAVGKTKISFDFTPGSTIDSNIIETESTQDILSNIENLEVNITP